MSYITLPERMILETLSESPKTSKELARETKIDPIAVNEVLRGFIIQGIIAISKEKYAINKHMDQFAKDAIKDSENIKIELQEITKSTISKKVDAKVEDSFKLKKVYMSDREEKIYRGLLYNLESFISSLQKNKGVISNKKIIFWGENDYENLIDYTFSS